MKTKPILLLVLIFAALLCWLQAPGHALPASAPDIIPGEVLVGMRAGRDTSDAVFRVTNAVGGAVRSHQAKLHSYRLKIRQGLAVSDAIALLQQNPDVLYAEPNVILHALATPSDPYYNNQYGPQRTQTDLAWDQWAPKAQVVIAIVDTGIDYTHPDLVNKIDRDASGNLIGYNATGANAHSNIGTDPIDDHGHGTHCAGIAAAEVNNGIGIAGIAGWASQVGGTSTTSTKVMPVKVLDSTGNGTTDTVAAGVTWAVDHGAQVISMSLGGGGTTTLGNAVQYAWSKGCVVVAASGNSGAATPIYPAGYPNVISVAATDSSDALAYYSDYGSWVTVAAPGTGIYSTTPTYSAGGGFTLNYGTLSGTSMATPHVAGEAALLAAQDPTLTNTQIRNLILNNVDPYSPYQGRTIAANAGRINVYRAVLAATPSSSPATSIQINCGGPAYTSPTTGTWQADTNFVGGSTYAVTNSISGTSDPTLYQSERYGSFEYSLPAANGNYILKLHFAETYYTVSGQRVFNVSVNGTQVLSNFDVVAAGGPNAAVVKSFPISVTGGSVSLTFQSVVNLPILSAIELVPNGATTPPPAAPTALSATGGNAQVSLSWTGSTGATSYNVKRGTATGGPYAAVASNVATTSYTDTSVTNGTKYYYVVTAVGTGGESANSNEASATPVAPATSVLQINCGGSTYASPTTGTWQSDTSFTGGSTYSVSNPISGTSDPTLYQSERYGSFNYSLPVNNGNYTLNLHFAETYYWAAGQRVFNVSVNGNQVLSNFDVVAAGGPNAAVVKSFPVSVTNGTLSITFQSVVNVPILSAIQLVTGGGTSQSPPAAPTALTAAAGNAQVGLGWTGSAGATSYNVKRGTATGGPYAAVASNVTATTYTDTGVTNGTTYYYVVTAVGTGGESANSNEANATPAVVTGTTLHINCGGPAYNSPTTGAWQADTYFAGGSVYAVNNPISGTSDPTLYQSERYGSFSYSLPATNGNYTLNLHFAETYYTAAGQRVFNVSVNGTQVLSNFDAVAAAGPNAAIVKSFPVSVTNGTVSITFQNVVNVPILSAIALVPAGP